MSLMDAAVATMTALLPQLPGSGVVAGTYTPAGGAPVDAHGAVFIREEPHGRVQRRGATLLLLQSDIADEPTDGATFLADDITWTVRTALRQVATWRCEAWA
jgi:hypothetical protein